MQAPADPNFNGPVTDVLLRNCENVERDQSGCNQASQGKQKNSEIEVEHG
jgi:hypothetical protein